MAAPTYFTCTLGQASLHRGAEDRFININDSIKANSERYGDLPAVGFYVPTPEQWAHQVLTFSQIHAGSCNTARLLSGQVALLDQKTVALLCPSTPDFLFTWLGLMGLGHAVLLIAPQCSPIAIAELCKQCEVGHLFHDDMYQELAQSALEKVGQQDRKLLLHPLPFDENNEALILAQQPAADLPRTHGLDKHDVAYLHHTSGTSSGVPKPIPQTHNAGMGVYAHFDGSQHATFTTTPLYHGGIADLFRAWTSHALIWLFPGKGAPITATNIIRCLETAEAANTPPVKYFSSVPYVLQMMASDDRGLKQLQKMDIVGVGGAALPADIGDGLVNERVNLISRFGSAECGFLMSSHRDYGKDKEWQFLRAERGSELLSFEKRDGGLSELVVQSGWPHMAKKNREDGSFATSDLFQSHVDIPNAWKYHSRADSQLTLVTGKKFDPAPLEDAIAASSADLQDVLIFGNGRPYPGALLFRSLESKDKDADSLIKALSSKVEQLNQEGQSHTRIPLTMLFVLPYAEKPLEKSSKGTVLRNNAEKRYAVEIESAYRNSLAREETVPDDEVEERVLDIIRSTAGSSKGHHDKLEADTDLFAFGLDSVACVQVRQAVSNLLPEGSSKLPLTVVQDTGSVGKLSQTILDLRHGRTSEAKDNVNHLQMMQDFVDQYSHIAVEKSPEARILPRSPPRSPNRSAEVVLITGSTGSLGSHVLSQLVDNPSVKHIHVLIRGATQKAAEERVRKALVSRQLKTSPDFESKVSIHVCLLYQPRLGLSGVNYNRLVQDVDLIYHLAWSVDFVLPLPAFKQHFIGLQSLLKLALLHSKYGGEPARMIFCSSTASVASHKAVETVPEVIVEHPEAAGDIGYSSSKWVAENICAQAARAHPGLDISVVRVGQLAGDSKNGVWNASEAYPMLLSSLKATGCLPDLPNESVGWVPVDVAATAFLEASLCSTSKQEGHVRVLHLLSQDDTTTWRDLLKWLGTQEEFEIVEPKEWLIRLERLLNHEDKQIASLKLLDFWKKAYRGDGKDADVERGVRYGTEMSTKAMPVLGRLKPVDEAYVLNLWSWIKENV